MKTLKAVFLATALAFGVADLAQAQQAVKVQPTLESIAREVERARDVQEIQNLMARRMWYHTVGQNEMELSLWSKKQPVRWAQNQGCFVGMKSINVYYNTVNEQMQRAELARLSKLNPAIANDWPKNRNIGTSAIHSLASPLIVVADDGASAKGSWYTPGVILTTQDGKTPIGIWIWERYGVDVIKEDGQWRFLNVQVNTDFGNPMGEPLRPQSTDAAAMGAENSGAAPAPPGPGGEGIKIPDPDIAKTTYREFGATRVPTITPRLPVPYRTLSETFQYADCSHPYP